MATRDHLLKTLTGADASTLKMLAAEYGVDTEQEPAELAHQLSAVMAHDGEAIEQNSRRTLASRYADGWDFTGRDDTYLREAFDLFVQSDDEVYASGARAIVEESHARALKMDTLHDDHAEAQDTSRIMEDGHAGRYHRDGQCALYGTDCVVLSAAQDTSRAEIAHNQIWMHKTNGTRFYVTALGKRVYGVVTPPKGSGTNLRTLTRAELIENYTLTDTKP